MLSEPLKLELSVKMTLSKQMYICQTSKMERFAKIVNV